MAGAKRYFVKETYVIRLPSNLSTFIAEAVTVLILELCPILERVFLKCEKWEKETSNFEPFS